MSHEPLGCEAPHSTFPHDLVENRVTGPPGKHRWRCGADLRRCALMVSVSKRSERCPRAACATCRIAPGQQGRFPGWVRRRHAPEGAFAANSPPRRPGRMTRSARGGAAFSLRSRRLAARSQAPMCKRPVNAHTRLRVPHPSRAIPTFRLPDPALSVSSPAVPLQHSSRAALGHPGQRSTVESNAPRDAPEGLGSLTTAQRRPGPSPPRLSGRGFEQQTGVLHLWTGSLPPSRWGRPRPEGRNPVQRVTARLSGDGSPARPATPRRIHNDATPACRRGSRPRGGLARQWRLRFFVAARRSARLAPWGASPSSLAAGIASAAGIGPPMAEVASPSSAGPE